MTRRRVARHAARAASPRRARRWPGDGRCRCAQGCSWCRTLGYVYSGSTAAQRLRACWSRLRDVIRRVVLLGPVPPCRRSTGWRCPVTRFVRDTARDACWSTKARVAAMHVAAAGHAEPAIGTMPGRTCPGGAACPSCRWSSTSSGPWCPWPSADATPDQVDEVLRTRCGAAPRPCIVVSSGPVALPALRAAPSERRPGTPSNSASSPVLRILSIGDQACGADAAERRAGPRGPSPPAWCPASWVPATPATPPGIATGWSGTRRSSSPPNPPWSPHDSRSRRDSGRPRGARDPRGTRPAGPGGRLVRGPAARTGVAGRARRCLRDAARSRRGRSAAAAGLHRRATFLPQVWEQLPAPADFLAALKRKAGMAVERPVDGLMAARYGVRKWRESERPSDDPARATGTRSTTAASSATCARATASCTKASAAPASCAARRRAARWC
jgi:hypothetical protein